MQPNLSHQRVILLHKKSYVYKYGNSLNMMITMISLYAISSLL